MIVTASFTKLIKDRYATNAEFIERNPESYRAQYYGQVDIPGINYFSQYREFTPPELVGCIVTELGIVTPVQLAD